MGHPRKDRCCDTLLGTPTIQLMNSLQSMTQMGRIGVPRSVSQQLSFRGWTRIIRADDIRQEWLTSGHPYSIGSMLPMMRSPGTFPTPMIVTHVTMITVLVS